MLDTTLRTTFIPGTNLKGQVTGANWTFLLPSLELGRVLCVGAPTLPGLANLTRLAREVLLVGLTRQQQRVVAAWSQQHNRPGVRALDGSGASLLLADSSIDLALVSDAASARRLAEDRELQDELGRVLAPHGLVYFDMGSAPERWRGDAAVSSLLERLGGAQQFWLTPLRGEMHTAVPLDDQRTIDFFLRNAVYSPAFKIRYFKGTERLLSRKLLFNTLARRQGALVGAQGTLPSAEPPLYLRQLAQAAGIDLSGRRWGLAAKGEYSSRKVLFFLFERNGDAPEYIVKMTRDPIFNARLENEQRALTLLEQRGFGNAGTLPQAVFFGQHGGLAIVGETAVDGEPFERRTSLKADCRYAQGAVEWLTALGVATADRRATRPLEVAEGLERLLKRFVEIYAPAAEQQRFLETQLDTLRGSRQPFPLVFQHGDPGTWNIVVNRAGQVAFLDWEAAEPQGLPLWDLFYFLRTYGVWASRVAGTRDPLKSFTQHFLADAPLGGLLQRATERYCEQVGLARELVEPLFYTCWMHRSLKEATRLPHARLQHGHYLRLLQSCIAQRQTPALRRLFR